MNIIVLGANSYLGQNILESFNKDKYKVFAILRDMNLVQNMKEYKIYGYCSIKSLQEKLIGNKFVPDIVINCICKYEDKINTELEIWESNFFQPLNLFLLLKEKGMKSFINFDTALPNDFNTYTKSKSLFANTLKWYSIRTECSVCNILLENYYGENEPENRFLPSIINKMKHNEDILLTEGKQKRDFIYIEDVVHAVNFIIEMDFSDKYIDIPLGTGESPTVREVVEYLHELLRSESKLLFGAIPLRREEPDSKADLSVLNKLGIKIQYTWKDGMKKII